MLSVNSIIDYFGNNEICLGITRKSDSMRVQVENAAGSTTHVPFKQIIAEYPGSSASSLGTLCELQNRIQAVMDDIDMELLWTDLCETPECLETKNNLAFFCEHYFGSKDSIQLSAMARALSKDTLHFQRQGQEFLVRSPEMVEEQRQLLKLRAERAAIKERRILWLNNLIEASAGSQIEVPEEMEDFIGLIRDYLLTGFNSDAVNLLASVKTKSTLRELALSLLKKTNQLPEGVDEFLLVNGIHAGFARNVLEYTDQLVSTYSGEKLDLLLNERKNLTDLEVFSIDDQWTKEIDDALSIKEEEDGYSIGIHLANPSSFVHKDDILDNAAAERPLSLYLPTTTVTMFPAALGCNLASLSMNELRPALSFNVHFSKEGEMTDFDFAPSSIRVSHRLTYIEADKLISDSTDSSSLAKGLRQLTRISSILARQREEDGGVNLNRPEIKIVVTNGDVEIYRDDQETPSHHLVREFMILANHLAAKYALRNDIPIIYRCQDASSEPVHSVNHYDPIDFDQQVRKMKRTRLSTYPQMHFGLGLDIYTQVSSPLRRYADLVMQRQLTAHFAGEKTPYSQEELFSVLDSVDRMSAQNRSLEREAHRFWMLTYLKQHCINAPLPATVVRIDGSLVLAELNDYYERGVVMTRDRMRPGQQLQVFISEVNLKLSRLSFDLA